MGLGATRRFLGALVAISTALLPVLVQPVAAGAASTGTLYGLVAASGTFSLGTVDPVSAAITPGVNVGLAPGQPGPAPGYGPWANDPNTHRFFLARVWNVSPWPPPPIQSFELLTVNVLTGTITARPTLARNLDSLVFDTSSGTLFGISADKQIVRVDPSTGVMTNLGAVTGDYFHMEIASASHTIYILSRTNGTIATRLITMDTLTNAVTTGPVLAPGVRGMVYDTSLGALFGLTFCCPSQLVRINPVSGVGTGVGGANLGLGGAFAIDSATHTAFVTQDVLGAFDLNQYIASINVLTGVKSLSPAIPSRTANVSRLMFEPLGGTPPPVDTSPPVTSIAPSPAANAAGWNKSNVTVNLSATDPDGVADVATVHYSATGAQSIAPTVVAGSTASFVVNTEGVTTITYFAKDKAGNTEVAKTQVVRIDKTLPTITYTGNTGTYSVEQTISITCTAVDPLNSNGTPGSGLASTTCANVNAPAYTFPLGPNTLSASAIDVAGNVGTGSTTFTVGVTFRTLCTLTVQFIETSPNFLSLPPRAQAHLVQVVNQLCILEDDQLPPDPGNEADAIAEYQKKLAHLVGRDYLTPAQAAILLTLSRAL